jgi:hypothetical protein
MSVAARSCVVSGSSTALADELATFVLCALEGAIMLSRAEKNVAPLEKTARSVESAIRKRLRPRR